MADDFFGRDEYDLFNRNVAGYLLKKFGKRIVR